ncbi:MAG: hypothetical protein L3K03_05900 [Thermoplasmata archaeon]|nr:hypothetical protein [Thermoplasmata archaeon]
MVGAIRRRTVYIGGMVAMLALFGGFVLASSTVGTFGTGQVSSVSTSVPGGLTFATVESSSLGTMSSMMQGAPAAGAQSAGVLGIGGSTVALTSCASASTCSETFNAVNGNPASTGDVVDQIEISVTQPGNAGTAQGFDIQVSINAGVGPTYTVADGYFSTGLATASGTSTVNVFLLVDLGTTTPQTVNSVSVALNSCDSATTCP